MESKVKLLGHPIHPMLIPFPLGLLGMAVIFDLLALFAGQTSLGDASRPMVAAGIITGLLAAVFGAIDWAALPAGTRAKQIATIHGLGNVVIVALFAIAWWLRRSERPQLALRPAGGRHRADCLAAGSSPVPAASPSRSAAGTERRQACRDP
jgi:uncharacterized membrane protein